MSWGRQRAGGGRRKKKAATALDLGRRRGIRPRGRRRQRVAAEDQRRRRSAPAEEGERGWCNGEGGDEERGARGTPVEKMATAAAAVVGDGGWRRGRRWQRATGSGGGDGGKGGEADRRRLRPRKGSVEDAGGKEGNGELGKNREMAVVSQTPATARLTTKRDPVEEKKREGEDEADEEVEADSLYDFGSGEETLVEEKVESDGGREGVDTEEEEGGSSGIRTRKKTASRGRGGRRSGGGRRQGGRRLFLADEETEREKEESGEQRRRNKGKGDLQLRWLSAVATDNDGVDEGRRWCSAR